MFKRLFGKKDKFFLELKEDATKAVGQVVEQAEKAIEKTTETISQVVDTKTAEPAKVEKVAEAKPAKNAKAAAAAKTKEKKTSIKDKKGKTEAKPVAETKPAPAPANQNGKVDPTEVAFASKNPVMSTMSRRTPGPSLNSFKEMARTAKIPNRKG
ncbi:hypothetical protein C7H19_01305 [Aphanothece hegewaldii CCALA 016]|uniref:Uncharacterized protein n=1 Tax=Aphanothece hegewaldii CCALA 016 TaxID=2107694 RepID=A0A2T1M3N5_9CHRO|nr:hypothetical protein [Aphanothece hegewaldii]PSF39454.1 hypothetical protein C7H19_01305 [Aphanothece hegewaldii CCALA 016]